ncbi:unnamed protein product [Schistosoma turkestanicum]|nr:unnamed protein product [Schistosoma turkestanicum]
MAAVASLKHVFGYRTGISGSIVFADDRIIVYPCGSNLVLYNVEQNVQKFIAGLEKSEGMTALAISPNRRFVALAEKTPDKPVVIVYDVHTLRKKKTLYFPDVHSTEFVSIAFSPDSKYLVVQSGGPDWILTYWSWENSKQLASIKTSTSNTVKQVSFCPHDCAVVCVIGTDVLRFFRYGDNVLKTFGLNKLEPQNFNCHTWISGEKMVLGTDDGRWILVENGESKLEYDISTISEKHESSEEKKDNLHNPNSIVAIVSTSKGLAVGCSSGYVYWFENMAADHSRQSHQQDQRGKHEKSSTTDQKTTTTTTTTTSSSSKHDFQFLGSIRLPHDSTMSKDSDANSQQTITQLQVNPSEDLLVAATNTHQLYQFNLNNIDTSAKTTTTNKLQESKTTHETMTFNMLSQSFHYGQILNMDVCIRKPLIVTCATDKTVRIWNFETNDLELTKSFVEEVYSVALHPTGLFLLVGFSDKLRLMNILLDDLRIFREFTIRGCRECSFSNGGHLIAAVNGNVIQIFSITSFENLINLKGHNGKIRSMSWSDDDHKLISCGLDGAVYEWDTQKGIRINESVLKTCNYTSATVSSDAKTVYAVGSDKTLKEISESQINIEIQSTDHLLFTTVAVSRTGRMLFCGCQNGLIRSFQMPLKNDSTWQDYVGHCDYITKMKMSTFDEYLVTVSNDCSVMVWRIQEREARPTRTDKDDMWMEEMLITKSDLQEKISVMNELRTRVEELKLENEYQLRLKDMNYNERIKELTEKFIQEMETLKTKNQLLKNEKEQNLLNHHNRIEELIEKHSQELQTLEYLSNQKLLNEYNKYHDLEELKQTKENEYEEKLMNLELKNEQLLRETIESYELKLNDQLLKIEQLSNELKQQTNHYEISKRLVEEDADREILEIKINYEKQLHHEHDANVRLKTESNVLKKKFTSFQNEINDNKNEIRKYSIETQKLNTIINNLEKDIQSLRKEIQERDDTIQDKDKGIFELKKKNQELEKFRYVLDYKVKDLKKQIEPKEIDIRNYKEQIQEMEAELQRFQKQNDQLEINITELKQKYKSVENELKLERQSTRDVESIVRRLKTDLFNVVGMIQEPKQLKAGILALYKKHIHEDMTVDATADADIQKEFCRQREHLERSIIGLRHKLARDTEVHRTDYVRIMQENVTLIQEIDNLRAELKLSRSHIHDLEAVLGLNRKDGEKARQLLLQLNKSRPNPILESDYEQMKRSLIAQQLFINNLQMKLNQSLQGFNNSNNNNNINDNNTTDINNNSSIINPPNDLLKDFQSAIYSSSSPQQPQQIKVSSSAAVSIPAPLSSQSTSSSSSSSSSLSAKVITTTAAATVTSSATEVAQITPNSSSNNLPPISNETTDEKSFTSSM